MTATVLGENSAMILGENSASFLGEMTATILGVKTKDYGCFGSVFGWNDCNDFG